VLLEQLQRALVAPQAQRPELEEQPEPEEQLVQVPRQVLGEWGLALPQLEQQEPQAGPAARLPLALGLPVRLVPHWLHLLRQLLIRHRPQLFRPLEQEFVARLPPQG